MRREGDPVAMPRHFQPAEEDQTTTPAKPRLRHPQSPEIYGQAPPPKPTTRLRQSAGLLRWLRHYCAGSLPRKRCRGIAELAALAREDSERVRALPPTPPTPGPHVPADASR